MKVQFINLEFTNKNSNIEEMFLLLEKNLQFRLPQYTQLEGGIYPSKDGTFHKWPGPHYYLCIPFESFSVLTLSFFIPYGKILSSTEQEVDDSICNENYTVCYAGPGFTPSLEKID